MARGGSWDDDDAAKLRVAARRASNNTWKIQDPQTPKEHLVSHRRAVPRVPHRAPAEGADGHRAQAYWNSGVEKDNPELSKAE